MARRAYKQPRAWGADLDDEHALTVQDADRLNEVTPVLKTLEKVLGRRNLTVDFEFGAGHLETIKGKISEKGVECAHAHLVISWITRKTTGTVLTIKVDGRYVQNRRDQVRPVTYDRRSTTDDFNYERIVTQLRKFVDIDAAFASRDLFKQQNTPAAFNLEKYAQAGPIGYAVRVAPDETKADTVSLKIDIARRLSSADAAKVLELLEASGAFDILNGD